MIVPHCSVRSQPSQGTGSVDSEPCIPNELNEPHELNELYEPVMADAHRTESEHLRSQSATASWGGMDQQNTMRKRLASLFHSVGCISPYGMIVLTARFLCDRRGGVQCLVASTWSVTMTNSLR